MGLVVEVKRRAVQDENLRVHHQGAREVQLGRADVREPVPRCGKLGSTVKFGKGLPNFVKGIDSIIPSMIIIQY